MLLVHTMLPDEKEAEKNRKIIISLAMEIEVLKDNVKQELKEKYDLMRKFVVLHGKYKALEEERDKNDSR